MNFMKLSDYDIKKMPYSILGYASNHDRVMEMNMESKPIIDDTFFHLANRFHVTTFMIFHFGYWIDTYKVDLFDSTKYYKI